MRAMAATVLALVVGLVLALGACGDTAIVGTYKLKAEDPEFTGATLVIHGDGTFQLSGTTPDADQKVSFSGTWILDGDKITLKAEGVSEAEGGAVRDGTLVFDEVTWVKQ